MDNEGKPITGARVEIWQCDVKGRYLHRGDYGLSSRDQALGIPLNSATRVQDMT